MSLKIGDKAIDFSLKNVDGSEISLADCKDAKALAVIFSCNHCPYVLAWEDRMIDIAKEYSAKGAAFALICANDAVKYPADSFPAMKAHAEEKGYPFPYLHDETQEVAKAYGAERTPEVFLFDGERKLVYHGAIDDNYDNPSAVTKTFLKDALDAVLSGQVPSVAETPAVGCTIKWK